jgi:cytochrome c-type biogenesis protein CcmH/NrfG
MCAYRESLRFEPGNAAVWYSLGNTYDELKLYGDAVEAYRKALRIQPKDGDALYSLGVDYVIEGERSEMNKIYPALHELDLAKPELYFNTCILP